MIHNIQILRAAAAFIVLFPHLGDVLKPAGLTEEDFVFGQFGVDLFFVISGFIMVHTCAVKPIGAGAFLLNRVIRVAPLYWLLTLALFVVALVVPQALGSTVADPVQLAKSIGFVPFLKQNGLIRPLLHVGWTLNYEMFFYLVFAAALWVTRGALNRTVLICSLVLILMASARLVVGTGTVVGAFYTDSIVLEFALGMGLAWMHGRGLVVMRPPEAVALIAVASLVLLTHRYLIGTGELRVIFAALPAVGIIFGAIALERAGWVANNRRLQLLGAASYSLYLSHPFVAQTLAKVSMIIGSPVVAVVLAVVTIVTQLIVAVLLFTLVEKPMTAWLRARIRERPPLAERVTLA